MSLSWMAWTWPTAGFFIFIGCAISIMIFWEIKRPGGEPRKGILMLNTTRGDRLFISLLGSAFIHIAWLGIVGTPIFIATIISILFFIIVFRWV